MERNPKVYKIWKADKSAKKLVGASTFDELSEKVEAKFAFKGHFCLEDGTEIEDDDALWSLDTDKIIYLCNDMPFIPEKLDLSTSDSDATVLNSSSTSSSDETSKNSGLFPIPLERFPYGFRLSLNKRNRPSPSDKRGAAKVLADKVVELNGAKGRKVFFSIARNVVELSPKSFSTDIGDGIEAFAGLIENAYYNHPVVRQRSKGSLKSKLQRDEKGSRKRKGSKDAYGCVEWQPDSYGDDETEDSQNQKQKWLQQQSTVEEKDLMKIKEYMTITYPSQRFFINQEPAKSMECVREEWPFLFDVPHYEAHFCRLTGTSPEIYQDNMEKKSQLLYKFFMEPNQSEHFKKWQTSIDEAKVVTGNNLPIVGGVVLMAMNYFKEDNKTLFFEVDVSTNLLFLY
ncbi:uncharacterized protein LOC117121231 [Anneissia japonica]|uniref:uncharacterized protein LOC117121231 n=1 Tax=Anneissia japonica TaxID=1529436 RepID=UPI0014257A27|nr:uncharacterized protein LOC117121231 [Anneissia japonica]